MDYFNARISRESAVLLKMMSEFYENREGIKYTKADTLAEVYEDAKWVPAGQWQALIDYQAPDSLEDNLSASATKLQIPLKAEVETAMRELNQQIRQELGVKLVKMGAEISYLLKAAYIKNNDPDTFKEIGGDQEEPLDKLFEQYTAALVALAAPGRAGAMTALLNQLKLEVKPK